MCKFLYLVVMVVVSVVVGCTYYHQDISILESVPYVDYGCEMSPDPIDGSAGFGVGGRNLKTSTDVDTTVNSAGPDLLFRVRHGRVEMGYSATFSPQRDHFLPYGLIDLKIFFADNPVIIAPDLAAGMGVGKAGFMFDGRTSLTIGLSLFDGFVNPYVAPKVILFFYPYEKSGIVPTLKWTACGISGVSGGLGFSIPLEVEEEKVTKSVKFIPEVSYFSGREPKQNRVGFNMLQLGGSLLFAF